MLLNRNLGSLGFIYKCLRRVVFIYVGNIIWDIKLCSYDVFMCNMVCLGLGYVR